MLKTEILAEATDFGKSLWNLVKEVTALINIIFAFYAAFVEGDFAKASFFAIIAVGFKRL